MNAALVTTVASLLALLGSGLLPLAAQPSRAATEEPSRESEVEAALVRAGELFSQGQDRFETSDFAGAIDLWTRAYENLPDGPELAATRALLLANIAQAHVEAYAIDHEIDHLRRADVLFEDYLAMVDPDDAETRATVQAEREKIAQAIAAHDQEEAARRQAEQNARQEEARRQARHARRQPAAKEDKGEPAARFNRSERAMILGGGLTLAFGIGTLGATGTFLWLRDEEEKDGRTAARQPSTTASELKDHRIRARRFNRLAISTGAASGVLTAIGLGLLGAARVHRVRRERRAVLGPGPTFAGASVSGWF